MKRERSTESDNNEQQRTKCETESYIEEIVTIEETQTFLVRMPFLDFFRNAHVCETKIPRSTNETNTSISSNNNNNNKELTDIFAPDALSFKAGTLETAHPILYLQTEENGEMEFEGSWCEVHGPNSSSTPCSNRAIVQLSERSDDLSIEKDKLPLSNITLTNTNNNNNNNNNNTIVGTEVASLLKHPAVGITADEVRVREKARNASWIYNRIDIPCATLVLRRIK